MKNSEDSSSSYGQREPRLGHLLRAMFLALGISSARELKTELKNTARDHLANSTEGNPRILNWDSVLSRPGRNRVSDESMLDTPRTEDAQPALFAVMRSLHGDISPDPEIIWWGSWKDSDITLWFEPSDLDNRIEPYLKITGDLALTCNVSLRIDEELIEIGIRDGECEHSTCPDVPSEMWNTCERVYLSVGDVHDIVLVRSTIE